MKFYYNAIFTLPFEDEQRTCLCSSKIELAKGDCIILDLGAEVRIHVAYVKCKVDELEALTKGRDETIREVIQVVTELKDYLKKKENLAKSIIIRDKIEEKAKEVKFIENMRKLSSSDPELAAELALYQKLVAEEASKQSEE